MTDIKKQQSAKHIFVRSKIDSILNQHKARQSMSFYFSLNHIKPCKKQLQKTKNIKIQEDKQHCLRHILHALNMKEPVQHQHQLSRFLQGNPILI